MLHGHSWHDDADRCRKDEDAGRRCVQRPGHAQGREEHRSSGGNQGAAHGLRVRRFERCAAQRCRPTAVGYLVQGGAKFAGYEFFKLKFSEAAGGYDGALKNRTAIYLGGAAVAEFIADIFLTPLEAVRIRLVSDRKYATGMASGLTRMMSEGGVGQLYAGFIPIVCKQVPYALGQFVVKCVSSSKIRLDAGQRASPRIHLQANERRRA